MQKCSEPNGGAIPAHFEARCLHQLARGRPLSHTGRQSAQIARVGCKLARDTAKQQNKQRKLKTKKRWKPTLDENGTPQLYHNILNQTLEQQKPTTLQGIERLILNAVEQEKLTMVSRDAPAMKMSEDQDVQQLL